MKGGSAGPWAVQKMTTYLAMAWPSWKTFEEELQATFYPVDLAKNALNSLIHLCQTVVTTPAAATTAVPAAQSSTDSRKCNHGLWL